MCTVSSNQELPRRVGIHDNAFWFARGQMREAGPPSCVLPIVGEGRSCGLIGSGQVHHNRDTHAAQQKRKGKRSAFANNDQIGSVGEDARDLADWIPGCIAADRMKERSTPRIG
jgi:hypothetical protein